MAVLNVKSLFFGLWLANLSLFWRFKHQGLLLELTILKYREKYMLKASDENNRSATRNNATAI
jgi:hypothetical protein